MTATAQQAPEKPGLLYKIGHGCARHRKIVLGVWIVAIVFVFAAKFIWGGRLVNEFSLPGTESQEAENLLTSQFPAFAGATAQVVFESKLDDPRFQGTPQNSLANPRQEQQMDKALDAVRQLDHVQSVGDPFKGEDGAVSEPGFQAAFASVSYDESIQELGPEAADELIDTAASFATDDIEVVAGGDLIDENLQISGLSSEVIGLVAALIILLIVLGAAAAMAIPIVSALVAVAVALQIIALEAAVVSVPTSANEVATMIGLGVGIDYALFITSRYMDGIRQGTEPEVAVGRAIATSGRAVVTAGSTVIVALIGLVVFQVPIVNTLAIAVVIMVVIAISTAITLLPTVLGFIGANIGKGTPRWLNRAQREGKVPLGFRWATVVTSQARLFLTGGIVFLLVLAIPMLWMELGPSTADDNPPGSAPRVAADIVSDNFGPGFNGPLLVAVRIPSDARSSAESDVAQIVDAIKRDHDVDLVAPAEFNSDKSVAVIDVVPSTGPQDTETNDLVEELRNTTLPNATQGTGLDALVGGLTAAFIDLDQRIAQRLGIFIALVILISFVILMTVFRSIAVPIKAAILNLLIIGATYGITVAVFQWGWLSALFGVENPAPIISFIPPFMFAVIFGLSMDYEVYLMSRIHEEYARTSNPREAVVFGTGKASRLIIAAALIMFSVFAAFIPVQNTIVKTFGVGLALAILLDAFIARMVLVPTSLYLLGHRSFWLPKWLDRVLPQLSAEGTEAPAYHLDDSEDLKEVAAR